MNDDEARARQAEAEELCLQALGLAMPDRIVEWLGVGRRAAERWLSGALSWPEPIVAKLRVQAPLAVELHEDLARMAAAYKGRGMHENLIRIRMREFAKELSDEPPPKEAPRRISENP